MSGWLASTCGHLSVVNTACRAYVDESDAAVAELTAKKTFSRPQLWDTAENADSFDGIGPLDRFGLTQQVQVARAAHASHYTALLRAGRTAAARKYLTQEEGGEGDANLGMQPYRCEQISICLSRSGALL